MLTWYEEYKFGLTKEAGMKSNLFMALVTVSLLGLDIPLVKRVAEKLAVPIEQINRPKEDPIWNDVRNLIGSNDPRVQEAVSKSQEIASDIKRTLPANSDVENPSVNDTKGPLSGQEADIYDNIIKAIIQVEGSGASEVSSAGATGVMQLLKPTWEEINTREFGGKYPYEKYAKDAKINKMFGRKYVEYLHKWLSRNSKRLKGPPLWLLYAAYNGGMGMVAKYKFNPDIIREHNSMAADYADRAVNLTN